MFKKILLALLILVLIAAAVFAVIYLNKPEPEAHVHTLVTVKGSEPTCTESGLKDYQVCSECDFSTLSEEHHIHELGHKIYTVKENIVEATCIDLGSYDLVDYCERCGVEVSRTEHPIELEAHDYVTVEAKAATCQPGHYEYEKCSVCKKIKGYVEIPPAYDHISSVHPIVYQPSVEYPTCTDDGSYMMAICCTNDDCDFIFNIDSLCGPFPITALGHTLVDISGKAATCTAPGYTEYKKCTRADCRYIEGRESIDPLGHDIITHDAKPATCTEDGWNEYEACSVCNYSTKRQNTINKYGHKESDIIIENLVEPTCTTGGSYNRVIRCLTCNEILGSEYWEVDPVAHNTEATIEAKAPTCTEIGWEGYVCCSKCGYSDDYVELPAKGHTLTNHEAKAPTCTEIGWDAYVDCDVCDYTTYNELPALDHDLLWHEGKAMTCLENGYHPYATCTRCDYSSFSEILAPGTHNLDANGYCQNPWCSERVSVGGVYVENSQGGYTFVGPGESVEENYIIASEINGVPVTEVASEAFYSCSEIKTVVIPASVKVVASDAFFYCKNLESVVIEGAEEISSGAFFYCYNLKTVTICGQVKTIGADAFNYCPITTVNYLGSAADWNAISIARGNEALTGANRNYI